MCLRGDKYEGRGRRVWWRSTGHGVALWCSRGALWLSQRGHHFVHQFMGLALARLVSPNWFFISAWFRWWQIKFYISSEPFTEHNALFADVFLCRKVHCTDPLETKGVSSRMSEILLSPNASLRKTYVKSNTLYGLVVRLSVRTLSHCAK